MRKINIFYEKYELFLFIGWCKGAACNRLDCERTIERKKMPFISIRVGKSELTETETTQLIERTTVLMTDVMKKKAERVSVQISHEDPSLWAVGRKRVADMDGCAVRMSIDVTEGTNSISEKEDMVAASTEMLDRVLKINPEATYIIINEIPGVSWGKGGIMLADRTKADREAGRRAEKSVA